MIALKPSRKEWTILLVTVAVALIPLVVVGGYIAQKHRWAQSRLAELEPRYARLNGLDLQRSEIEGALAHASEIRSAYVFPADQTAVQTGNAVQQKVRDLLTTAGLTVVSSQVLPAKSEKGFDRIPLSVRAEGEMLAVATALAVLNEQLPVLLLNDVEVRNQGSLQAMNTKVAPRIGLQLSLSVLKEQQP
ncbi:type II secretion system protein GspM [Comamonas sp. J-3]|jgi:general secretion pathway protein M|uniref:type II secretion system protein GspM n=1 Tax=Comamonas trifloxystrobinivorans TaxID=3350256 RepID=UPI003727BBA3